MTNKLAHCVRRIGPGGLLLAVPLLLASTILAASSIPLISQTVPVSVPPGTGGISILVNGTGFAPGAVAYWNGTALSTQYVSASQVSITTPSSDLALPGTASITVQNPGGQNSNTVYFQIGNPEASLGFSGPQLPTNGQAFAVSAGDFTGTGKLDLVSGNTLTSSVSVVIGNGDGTFNSTQSYAVGAMEAFSVVTADFDGDGKLDIAAAAVGATSVVSVLLGNGDGTFQTHRDLAVTSGEILTDLVVADFNGDGKLDLAIMGESNKILIALGKGDGTFQTARSYAAGSDAEWATAGDFNGDGFLDLAVANYVDSTVSILLGNGDGTFKSQVVYPGPLNPGSIVAADFNGDGKLDLAMTARTTDTTVFAVSIMSGNGDGSFQPHMEYTTGEDPAQIVAADFNDDGKLDLATINACGDDANCGSTSSSTVSIFAGNGDSTFAPRVDFPAGLLASQLVAADFNGDGKCDLVSASGLLSVLLQTTATLSSGALLFTGQDVGMGGTPQVVTLTNTASTVLTINEFNLTGADPGDYSLTNTCAGALEPGASCTISVTFAPTAEGTRTAFVSISDSALGSPQTIALTGTGLVPQAVVSPASLTFLTTLVGHTAIAQIVAVENPGNAPLNISSIVSSGDFSDVSACPASLAAGEGCTIAVYFKPTRNGVRAGTVTVTDNALNSPQIVTLRGIGTWFKLSAGSLNFGNVKVGQSSRKVVTLTNTGRISQAINGISIKGPNANQFSQSNTCGSTLGAGAGCQITVTFTPAKRGPAAGALQVNGGGGVETTNLTGNGA